LYLDSRFANDGLNFLCLEDTPHSKVHEWYQGPIPGITNSPAGWYRTNDTGFGFSLLADGHELRKGVRANYSGLGSRWGGAVRNSWKPSNATWPNIEIAPSNPTDVFPGQSISLLCRIQDFTERSVALIGTDDDANPFNSQSPNDFLRITNSLKGATTNISINWKPTIEDSGKYVYAAVANQARQVRLYYLTRPIQVVTPRITSIALLKDKWLEVAVSGTLGRTFEVLGSPDVATNTTNWVSLGSITSDRFTVSPNIVTNFSRVFFQLKFPQ